MSAQVTSQAEKNPPTDPLTLRLALERVRPEMEALRDHELQEVNLDPTTSASIARGALPHLRTLRREFVTVFRVFDMEALDRLELYGFALTQAHAVYQGIRKKSVLAGQLATRAVPLRAKLFEDVQLLARRGLIAPSRLARVRCANGFQQLANELLILAEVLRDSLPNIEGKTTITRGEIDEALELGNDLVTAMGIDRHKPERAARALRDRQRAFTLFVRAYDELRRAVIYLRWHHGDADKIAPSLYAKTKPRTARKRKQTDSARGRKQMDSATRSKVPDSTSVTVDSSDSGSGSQSSRTLVE